MSKDALIIFVRKPEIGKVKTRLAASVGDDAALAIYQRLLEHTRQVTLPLDADKFVFYAGEIVTDDGWSEGYHKRLQDEGILGKKMKAAFQHLFSNGYKRICIIGSDCFDLTTPLLQQAFEALAKHEMVVGPAADGGYYLLGMKGGLKDVFDSVEWSTDKVLEQTLKKITLLSCSYTLLPVCKDVDTADDVPPEILAQPGC